MDKVRFVQQRHRILTEFDGWELARIERAARTCYQSDDRRVEGSDRRLVRHLVKRGHEAMLEFSHLEVELTTDRAIANEIVRHRHFSFAQESTRYVNYGRHGFEFVLPSGMEAYQRIAMEEACEHAANQYAHLVRCGTRPETARSVLPLCTATRIVVGGNYREWRHFFRLRCAKDAHPMMRELADGLLADLLMLVPVVFDDVWRETHDEQ